MMSLIYVKGGDVDDADSRTNVGVADSAACGDGCCRC